MTVYSLFLFNKFGDCIYHADWNRSSPSLGEGEKSLVAGLVYTLQQFSSQLSVTGIGGFKCMRTPHYKLHYLETMTKYRFAMTTDVNFDGNFAQEILRDIFEKVFVEWVVKDPGYRHEEGAFLTSPVLGVKLKEFLVSKRLL